MLERTRSFFSSNSTIQRLRDFLSGNEYPPLVALGVLIGYVTRTEVPVIALLILISAFGVLVSRDFKCVLPPLLIVPFSFPLPHSPGIPTYSDYYLSTWVIVLGAVCGTILLAAVVMHFLLWGGLRETFLKKTELTPYLIVLSIGLIFNGVGAKGYSISDFLTGFSLVALWVILYLIFLRGLKYDKALVEYVCNLFQWVAVLLVLQLVFIVLTNDVISDGVIIKDQIMFGWGINNNYGGVFVWLIPPIFYLASIRKNGWIQLFISVLSMGCIFFSMCRSALVVGAGVYLVCLLIVCFKGNNKVLFRMFSCGCIVTAGILLIFFRESLFSTFRYYLDRGFSDSGRFQLWGGTWEKFLEYPIIGAGFHATPWVSWAGRKIGYCHNTVIQLFSAGGLVAGVSYLLMRVKSIWVALYRPTVERIFMALSLAALLGVSLLDNHMFNIYPCFFYALLLALVEQDHTISTTPEERDLRLRVLAGVKSWKRRKSSETDDQK